MPLSPAMEMSLPALPNNKSSSSAAITKSSSSAKASSASLSELKSSASKRSESPLINPLPFFPSSPSRSNSLKTPLLGLVPAPASEPLRTFSSSINSRLLAPDPPSNGFSEERLISAESWDIAGELSFSSEESIARSSPSLSINKSPDSMRSLDPAASPSSSAKSSAN